MIEVWRPLPEWEDFYSVSNHGRIRGETEGYGGYKRGRILKGAKDRDGYLKVSLFRKDTHKKLSTSIHRLVALTFIGVRPLKNQVNHINGDKSDNRCDNLEYVTCAENLRHAREILHRQGKPKNGEKHHNSKLSDADTLKIRLLASQGIKQREISKRFSVDPSLISCIVNNKIRKGNNFAL